MAMSIEKIADAIINDVSSGLRGYHQNMSMSKEQIQQEVVEMRLAIIKEYMMKGILPIQDLLVSINCIPVDCKDLDKCTCSNQICGTDPVAHFQIPQLLFDYGLGKAIYYVGSTDKQHPFLVYTQPYNRIKNLYKYRRRGKNKPIVYIDVTPNSRGLLDCYIFNAPLIKNVSIVAVFKDPRQLEGYQCSDGDCEQKMIQSQMDENANFIDILVKERLTKQKLYYYRQMASPLLPNDQRYAAV